MKTEIMVPTASQTVGPFFHLGCTDRGTVENLLNPGSKGERILLTCRVLDGDGAPVNDAMIEIWQANAEGKYNHPDDAQAKALDPAFNGFGRMATDKIGICAFKTIRPGRVPGNDGELQAAHVNVSVFARGVLKRLATRVYFDGDPALANDAILALVPPERRGTLMAKGIRPGEWNFDIHLCGPDETVFFDV